MTHKNKILPILAISVGIAFFWFVIYLVYGWKGILGATICVPFLALYEWGIKKM